MSTFAAFKRAMRRLTPLEMATMELAEAELAKLQAASAKEYASAMETYHDQRIRRLRTFIATQSKPEAPNADKAG